MLNIVVPGGENISPKAIEGLILSKFDLETDVVGIPDEVAGEVPVAVVKPKADQEVSTSEIHEVVVKELGTGSALQETLLLHDMQLDDFPKTTSGKVQKNVLSEQVQKHLEGQSGNTSGGDEGYATDTTADQVTEVWRKLLKVDDLTAEDEIQNWADSLVISRFPGVLKRETGHSITT